MHLWLSSYKNVNLLFETCQWTYIYVNEDDEIDKLQFNKENYMDMTMMKLKKKMMKKKKKKKKTILIKSNSN